MQIEAISREIHGHAVIGCHVSRCQAGRVDALDGHLPGFQLNVMFLGLSDNGGAEILIRLTWVSPSSHGHLAQIVLKRIVGQFVWNDLRSGDDDAHDDGESQNKLDSSHS